MSNKGGRPRIELLEYLIKDVASLGFGARKIHRWLAGDRKIKVSLSTVSRRLRELKGSGK